MLEAAGIDVVAIEDVRRAVHELAQVRDVLAHRGGAADDRFVAECPWLDATVGEEALATSAMSEQYLDACFKYWVSVSRAFADAFPVAPGGDGSQDA